MWLYADVIAMSFLISTIQHIHGAELNTNCVANKYSLPLSSNNWRVIYQYNCHQVNGETVSEVNLGLARSGGLEANRTSKSFDPAFPVVDNSLATEYNEIDLSPNVYTEIPFDQLCTYKYAHTVDLSSNRLSSFGDAFKQFKCLKSLKQVDLSRNLILTPLLANNFDDTVAGQLESLNLTSNSIAVVETRAFFRSDGSSRFPNLRYLGLANNLIKEMDFLWPLSLPHPELRIDLQTNPIDTLVNQLRVSFKDARFKYSMTGARYLDATNNKLQYLGGKNLLQYGIESASDLQLFLSMLSNYDLRQINSVRTFLCFCGGNQDLLAVAWFKTFASTVNTSLPIYQLYCSNFAPLVYVLDKSCASPQTTTRPDGEQNTAEQQVGETTTTRASEITTTPKKSNPNYYFLLLLLLLIPIFLFLVLIFACCLGRCCQVNINNVFNVFLCACLRPDKRGNDTKQYDATICFSDHNESWLDEEFIPQLSQFENNYKIHKLSLYNKSNDKLSRESERILRSSKRIVLIFSRKFYEHEWKNKSFRSLLREICRTDSCCVIVALNVGELSQKRIDLLLSEIEASKQEPKEVHAKHDREMHASDEYKREFDTKMSHEKQQVHKKSLFRRIKDQFKRHCSLNDIEKLNYYEKNFWKNFNYIMPRIAAYDDTKPAMIIDTTNEKRSSFKLPKLPSRSTSKRSESKPSPTSSNTELISSSKKTKTKKTDESEVVDYKRKIATSLQQIVVPIPDFMRTQLGFVQKREDQKKLGQQLQQQPQQQQQQQRPETDQDPNNLFSTIPATTPIDRQMTNSLSIITDIHAHQEQTVLRNYIANQYDSRPQVNEVNEEDNILKMFRPSNDFVLGLETSTPNLVRGGSTSKEMRASVTSSRRSRRRSSKRENSRNSANTVLSSQHASHLVLREEDEQRAEVTRSASNEYDA